MRTECLSEWIGARDREAGRLLGEKSVSPFPSPRSHLSSVADCLSEPPASHLTSTMRGPEHISQPSLLDTPMPRQPKGLSKHLDQKEPPTPPSSQRKRCVWSRGPRKGMRIPGKKGLTCPKPERKLLGERGGSSSGCEKGTSREGLGQPLLLAEPHLLCTSPVSTLPSFLLENLQSISAPGSQC